MIGVVVPCYNEGENIALLIQSACNILNDCDDLYFMFVNNGSTDETGDEIEKQLINSATDHIGFINIPQNIGYGHGILEGLNNIPAHIPYVGWMHGDLQTPFDVLAKCLSLVNKKSGDHILSRGSVYPNVSYLSV